MRDDSCNNASKKRSVGGTRKNRVIARCAGSMTCLCRQPLGCVENIPSSTSERSWAKMTWGAKVSNLVLFTRVYRKIRALLIWKSVVSKWLAPPHMYIIPILLITTLSQHSHFFLLEEGGTGRPFAFSEPKTRLGRPRIHLNIRHLNSRFPYKTSKKDVEQG